MTCRKVLNGNVIFFGKTGVVSNTDLLIRLKDEAGYAAVSGSKLSNDSSGNLILALSDTVSYYAFYDDDYEVNGKFYSDAAKTAFIGYFSRMTGKADNYESGTDGVIDSLIQRLSVIRGELWYQINYGIPLMGKYKSKGIFDSSISEIISGNPGVRNIISYKSSVDKTVYSFTCRILTIYGDALDISDTYTI
jgi:hypothetical protein